MLKAIKVQQIFHQVIEPLAVPANITMERDMRESDKFFLLTC
jgi:hypothetical protein